MVDIGVSMRTAFYDKTGELVVTTKGIRQNYMNTAPYWFFIDVAACFPGSYIEWYMEANTTPDATAQADPSSNKLLRLMRLLRLLKLLRLLRLNRLFAKYEEELQQFMTTISLWKILVGMGVVGHWLACFWYWAGSVGSEGTEECSAGDDGTPIQCEGWVDRRWGTGASARDTDTFAGLTPEAKRYFARCQIGPFSFIYLLLQSNLS